MYILKADRDMTRAEVVLNIVSNVILTLYALSCLYPLLNMIAVSLSSARHVMLNDVSVFPRGFNVDNYRILFKDTTYLRAFLNSVFYSVAGTALSTFLCALTAYPLSRKDYAFSKFFMKVIAVTMFFSGGLIPTYLVVRSLGMVDKVWSVIVLGAVSTWYIIILRTNYQNIPHELSEAATIDGCSELGLFFKILLPLSIPTIAVIMLYVIVGKWNDFYTPLIYLNDRDKWPLSVLLRNLVRSAQIAEQEEMAGKNNVVIIARSYISTALVVSTTPILITYPFLQRYFVKGILVGSLKG